MKHTLFTIIALSVATVLYADRAFYDQVNDGVKTTTNKVEYLKSVFTNDEVRLLYVNEAVTIQSEEFAETGKRAFATSYVSLLELLKEVSFGLATTNEVAAFWQEWDQRLFDGGFCMMPSGWWWYERVPKITEAFLTSELGVAYAAKNPVQVRYTRDINAQYPQFALAANLFSEKGSLGLITPSVVDGEVKNITKMAIRPIKRKIRMEGKSFVADGDNNPVQEEVDRLTATLQSAKCVGLKEFVLAIYPDYEWIDSAWMADADVIALKDAVFYGDKDLTNQNASLILFGIGLDAYNEFIRQYNGEQSENTNN